MRFDKDNVYQPDVFFIRTERLGIVDKHGAKGAPDLVAEVISGSTGRLDLGPKRMIYAQSGVREFWAILPDSREVEIFRFAEAADKSIATLGGDATLTTPVLPGFALPFAELFAE